MSALSPDSPRSDALQFRAVLPEGSTGAAADSAVPFSALRIEWMSAALRDWLSLPPSAEPSELHSRVASAGPLALRWPTQSGADDVVAAYRSTSYLAFGPLHRAGAATTASPAAASAGSAAPAAAPSFTEEHPLRVRVGERNAALDALLSATGERSATFITAWNPCSAMQSAAVNAAAHARLLAAVEREGRSWMEHIGRGDAQPKDEEADGGSNSGSSSSSDSSVWEEHGLLVLGWTREAALQIALRFAQNAVVFCEAGQAPQLEWSFDAQWPAQFSGTAQLRRADAASIAAVRIEGRAAEWMRSEPLQRFYECTVVEQ